MANPGQQGSGSTDLDELIRLQKQTAAQNKGFLEGNVAPSLDALGNAAYSANRLEGDIGASRNAATQTAVNEIDTALGDLGTGYGKYAGEMEGLNTSDLDALAKYQGQNADQISALRGMQWQNAQSGGGGYDAQADAIAKYKALTSPEITGAERFMGEKARRTAEQQTRSARDAVMGDLAARGLRSSGAELSNMLGAQQQIGQDRVLADLGMQKAAVDRSMTALEGYGRVGGEARNAEDIMSRFNAEQSGAFGQWKHQQEALRTKEGLDATTGVNKGVGDRKENVFGNYEDMIGARYKGATDKQSMWGDTFSAHDNYAKNAFDRQKDVTNATMDYGGLYTGGNRADQGQVADAVKAKAGDESAREAAAIAGKKSPSLFGWLFG